MPREDAGVLAGGDDEPIERHGVWPAAELGIERRVGGLGPPGHECDAARATPASRAISLLAFSTMRRAARPSAWTDEGLPVVSIALSAASRASARSGAVAL